MGHQCSHDYDKHQASIVGLLLRNELGYLSLVLHLYNLLEQLNLINTTLPAVSDLGSPTQQQVFLGKPPDRNFYSNFVRFRGSNLIIEQDTSGHTSGSRGKLAESSELENDENRRLRAKDLSLLAKLDSRHCQFDTEIWTRAYDSKRDERNTTISLEKHMRGKFFSSFLEELRAAAQDKFTGHFPCARIDHFVVYLLCTERDLYSQAYMHAAACPSIAVTGLVLSSSKVSMIIRATQRWRSWYLT